jgi:hypothetical protein
MISDGLFKKAESSGGLQAILGTKSTRKDESTGIFAGFAPTSAGSPRVVTTQVSGTGTPMLDGAEAFGSARWQFSCYAVKYRDAKLLARAVRTEFEGFHGTLADGTEVDSTVYLGEIDTFEDAPALFHVALDLEMQFRDVGK